MCKKNIFWCFKIDFMRHFILNFYVYDIAFFLTKHSWANMDVRMYIEYFFLIFSDILKWI
jgi:hypothetical protein